MNAATLIHGILGGSRPIAPPAPGNIILAIWTEDIARDWIRIECENSIGVTPPELTSLIVPGKEVIEVVMRFDKVLYIKVDSPFTLGESITFTYISDGSLGGLASQSVPVENNITAATVRTWSTSNYFLDVNTDFNTVQGSDPGDVWVIPAGSYGYLDIGRAEDQIFVCADDGNAEFTYCNFREAVLHATLIGHPARVQNLKLTSAVYGANFGIGCFATGNLRFEDYESQGHQQGIQVKTVSDLPYPPYNLSRTNYQNLRLKRAKIGNTTEEATYIGSDVAAPLIPISWDIEDIELWDIGRDGIQVRNGGGTVRRVTAYKVFKAWAIGAEENESHGHFCAFGTTSENCLFEDCNAEDIYSCAYLINGYGEVIIRRSVVSSKGRTITFKNYDGHDEFGVLATVLKLEGANSFECTDLDPYSLDARRNALWTTMAIEIGPDTVFLNSIYIEDMPVEEFPPGSGEYRGGIVVTYT